MSKKPYALVCACADRSDGLYRYEVSGAKLLPAGKIKAASPNYAVFDGDELYAAVGTPFENSRYGGVARYCVRDGMPMPDGAVVSTGDFGVCHVCAVSDLIFAANYDGGSAALIHKSAFDGAGEVKIVKHHGSGADTERQSSPHVHQICPTPDGKYVCVCDLGLDAVIVYDLDLCEISRTYVPEGRGPRHLVFSVDGEYAYCLTEMGNTVERFAYSFGFLSPAGSVGTLPRGFGGHSQAAAIRLSRDGRNLYVSNRGHDSIARIALDGGDMTVAQIIPCGGHWPRDINLTPDGEYLFCCNERSDSVTAFSIGGDGSLEYAGTAAENVPGPMNINFY